MAKCVSSTYFVNDEISCLLYWSLKGRNIYMINGFLYVVTKTNHIYAVRCSYKWHIIFVRLYEKPVQLESRTRFVALEFSYRVHLNTFSVVPALNTKYVPEQAGGKVNKLDQFQFIKGKTDLYFEPCPLPFFLLQTYSFPETNVFRPPSSLGLLHGDINEMRLVKLADVGSHPFSIML